MASPQYGKILLLLESDVAKREWHNDYLRHHDVLWSWCVSYCIKDVKGLAYHAEL